MIKFENTAVFNFEGALRGMRNPMNSWDKSDSHPNYEYDEYPWVNEPFIIGENDMNLAQKLIRAGSDHRKFMRQIFVSVDITAPLYWWKEFDTYKVATVANSCSTMHKIHSMPIEVSDFSIDDFDLTLNDTTAPIVVDFAAVVDFCESLRKLFVETNDTRYWRALIQFLPESYNQMRTVTLNYETIRNIYGARKNHKLSEWSVDFMAWIDTLPYADELIKI